MKQKQICIQTVCTHAARKHDCKRYNTMLFSIQFSSLQFIDGSFPLKYEHTRKYKDGLLNKEVKELVE